MLSYSTPAPYPKEIQRCLRFLARKHQELSEAFTRASDLPEWVSQPAGEIRIEISVMEEEISQAMFLVNLFANPDLPHDERMNECREILAETTSGELFDFLTVFIAEQEIR